MSIIASKVPLNLVDECGEVYQNIDENCIVKDNNPSFDIQVLYPTGIVETNNLPLSGGAILRLTYKNSKFEENQDYQSLIKEDLDSLNNFSASEDTLSNLINLRLIFNSIMRKVGRKDSIREKSNLPKIYISTYRGDDIIFLDKNDQYAAGMINVCELNYIPLDAINQMITSANASLGDKATTTVGSSGVSLKDLATASTDKKIMETFPIYNVSEQDLEKITLSNPTGGFYTFEKSATNEYIYIKMPDLSGKNSYGISSVDFIDKNFYLQVVQENSVYRVKLANYSVPLSIDFIGEFPIEYSESGDLEFSIETNKSINGATAYLSVVASPSPVLANSSGIDVSNDAVELFSAPILTAPVISGEKPTLAVTSGKLEGYGVTDISGKVGDYLITNNGIPLEKVGLPITLKYAVELQIGEENRPEILLFDSERENSKKSNDNKYSNPKLPEARNFMVSNRPKIYRDEQIPYYWLSSKQITLSEDGVYKVNFSSTELDRINKEASPNINFMFYILDSDGQLARAPRIVSLGLGEPTLTVLDPDGFIETREISPNKKLRLTIRGTGLKTVQYLNIDEKIFEVGANDDWLLTTTDNSVSFVTYKNIIEPPFSLSPSTTYNLSVTTRYGKQSKNLKFYVSDGENNLIAKTPEPAILSSTEFSFDHNGGNSAFYIPVKNGQNAILKINSKNKYFSGEYDLYAYLAIGSENKSIFEKIDLPSRLLDVNFSDDNLKLSVASTFEFKFSPSLFGQDFYRISDKKAGLKLPGDNFSNYNLASLIHLNKPLYILITRSPISELIAGNRSLSIEEYSIMYLGSSSRPAFVYPPYIYGMVAGFSDSSQFANFNIDKNNFSNVYERMKIKDVNLNTYEKISAFKKIPDLAIIFYGDGDSNYKKRCDFYIGTQKINKYLTGTIEPTGSEEFKNLQVAFFKNIKISEQGDFPVYVSKKNKNYDIITSGETVIRTESLNVTLQSQENFVVTSADASYDNFSQVLPSVGSGVAFTASLSKYYFYNPIKLVSNFDIILKTDSAELNVLRSIPEETTILDSNYLKVKSETIIYNEDFISESLTDGLAYLNLEILNPQVISFNKPEILKIVEGANKNPNIDPNKIVLKGDREYTATVKSSDKNLVLLFDKTTVVKPKSIRVDKGDNNWIVVFRTPKKLVSLKCPEICVSITNSTRNNVKLRLGERFVIDIDEKMKAILDGTGGKRKIPNPADLINLITDFPLRFVNINLGLPNVPTDLINSFCDMSFHLTADLKIALNGFQILMTPIQIIFCIIDVICALLNPVKLARAVIRLFQCLYDLVLILPVISVPVMLLQLIIHLLILLECLFDKILTICLVINEILIILLDEASTFWEAIKSLEELLSEYFLDIGVNLSVLTPIISILSIFLQLLGLTFRFPCSITDDMDQYFCLDGTMVAGLIAGKMMNSDNTYNFNNLIPVAQSYSEKTTEQAILDNTSDPLIDPVQSDICAVKTESQTYLDSMAVDPNTLRSTYAGAPTADGNFNLTFGVSVTKSRKGLGSSDLVEFQFKEKGRNGFFNKKKIIDSDQTLDSLIYLIKEQDNVLSIETGDDKNIISPVDGHKFIRISDDAASVKPLVLNVEVPIEQVNPETGQKELVGVETIPRTFDNIPSLAIIDEQNFVYFVEPDGIKLKNGVVDSIVAKVINTTSASKIKFSKEDAEIDTNSDGYADEEAPVFEFPQIYFFDMRSIATDIETKCGIDFFNNELLQNNPDDILSIVQKALDCVTGYQGYINTLVSDAQSQIAIGQVPQLIDINQLNSEGSKLNNCLNEVIDDICIYVVNTLNSQFKILEDTDPTPLGEFPITEVTPELADDFDIIGPTLTGAREYSDGIGDSANIKAGEFATIQITPRDSYDNVMPGDYSEKIVVEIVSDTTGTASFIETNEKVIVRNGNDYFAKLTASKPGIVKIRSKICSKTIQAVTYPEVASQVAIQDTKEVDCVPEAQSASLNPENALGQLTKIDRILTIFFIEGSKVITSSVTDGLELAKADPQAFGSSLEN